MSVTVMLGGDRDALGPTIECAIGLAKRSKTSLTGLCAMPDPASYAVYVTGAETVMMGASAIESLTEAQNELAKALEATFEAQTHAAGSWLKADFVKQQGAISSHAAAASLLSNAFVLPHAATESSHPLNPAFEHVLMEAELPLVLAPAKPSESDTCLIAWDGSPLAARSVRLHMPLIATYKQVVIAQHPGKLRHQWAPVCGPTMDHLTELLRNERLDVSQVELEGRVSDALLKTAETHDASLIVMGAYGHTRIGELLFGGTTSKLLHSDKAPALALCR